MNKEDVFAMAYRLALPPDEPVDVWRTAILNIARSEGFIRATPQDVPLTRDDWERWKTLEASRPSHPEPCSECRTNCIQL
ncbi:MAG: hypothetical protein ACE15C_16485 [Phycisphaerae bacterium]